MSNPHEDSMPGLEGAGDNEEDEVIVMEQDEVSSLPAALCREPELINRSLSQGPSSRSANTASAHFSSSTASSSRRPTRSSAAGGSRRGPGAGSGGGHARGMSNFDRERNEIERQSGRGGNRNEDGRQGNEQNIWDKVLDKNGGYQGMCEPFFSFTFLQKCAASVKS
jgi:hypothetical protein